MKGLMVIGVLMVAVVMVVLSGTFIHAEYHHVDDCSVCHYAGGAESTACVSCPNNVMIKCEIMTPNSGLKGAVFGPYVWAEDPYNGVCEVCHTDTAYHRNDALGDHTHYTGENCILCHKHSDEFTHGDGQPCDTCHGHAGGDGTAFSHATHTEGTIPKGPPTAIGCGDCHDTNNFPLFGVEDAQETLATTTVCNPCHSPGGAYDGVNDSEIGAKANWADGIYEADGKILKPGKEKWCAGCHDSGYIPSIIVDTEDATLVGNDDAWGIGDSTQQHGASFAYNLTDIGSSGNDTATWVPDIPETGNYNVYAWWVAASNRATDAPFTINHEGGSTTVDMDQTTNGAQWNFLGTYPFAAGTSGSVVLTDDANERVIADAIKLEPSSAIIVDTEAATLVGNDDAWGIADSTQQHGASFAYNGTDIGSSGNDTATWVPDIPKTGNYNVYAWWVAASNRATDAPFTINYDGGSATVDMDQTTNGAQWNFLGTYPFAAGTSGSVVLIDDEVDGYIIADAIMFVPPGFPVVPPPNVIGDDDENYGFYETGHGANELVDCLSCHDAKKNHIDNEHRTYAIDKDDTPDQKVVNPYCESYRLKSNSMEMPRPNFGGTPNRGEFLLCFGCHNSNEVLGNGVDQDDFSHTNFWDGFPTMGWYKGNGHTFHLNANNYFDSDYDGTRDSRPSCANCHNVHGSPAKAMIRHGELISTPGTTNKVPAVDFAYLGVELPTPPFATVTWPAPAGSYDVYAWWVQAQNRATNAPFTINHDGGSPTVDVDQTINGGQWNRLGTVTYTFGAADTVVLSNEGADGYVIADALLFDANGNGIDDGLPDVVVDNDSAGVTYDGSWGTGSGADQQYGSDFGYHAGGSFVPDTTVTLKDSRGGWMQDYTTPVCGACHAPSHAEYVRVPKLWPKVISQPGAEPKIVVNDGSGSSLIKVLIVDPDNNVSTVTIDLFPIGGSADHPMTDNQDGTWQYLWNVAPGTTEGPYRFEIKATDDEGSTGTMKVTVSVVEPGAVIVDTDGITFVGGDDTWKFASGSTTEHGDGFGVNWTDVGSSGNDIATWVPDVPAAGDYKVYAWWVQASNRATDAPFTINYDGGSNTVDMDQTKNGGQWNYLGTYPFAAGTSGSVVLTDDANERVIADAIKLVPVS